MRRPLVAALVVLALAGCTSSGSGSRAELYDSVAGIVADSALVVVARVTVQDGAVSTVEVAERFVPSGLGSGLPAGTRLPDKLGSTLQVQQVAEPYLERGQSYLLFLGPPADDGGFFPTGGTAGVYLVQGTEFVHGEFTEGDTLPQTLTRQDLG